MNLKQISILLALFLSFSFTALGQVEDEEVQMFSFSSSRGLSSKNVHDFGVVRGLQAFTIELRNNYDTKMQIGDIDIPEGIGVTLLKKVLNPGEKGGIVITVDPKLMKKGGFKKKVIITTVTQNTKGTIVRKTAAYDLKGQIL